MQEVALCWDYIDIGNHWKYHMCLALQQTVTYFIKCALYHHAVLFDVSHLATDALSVGMVIYRRHCKRGLVAWLEMSAICFRFWVGTAVFRRFEILLKDIYFNHFTFME